MAYFLDHPILRMIHVINVMFAESRCCACKQPICERFILKVQDRCWHPRCLRCTDCLLPLRDRCFMKADQMFCKDDFCRFVSVLFWFVTT